MIHVDPASPDFEKLSRPEQARNLLAIGWTEDAIADEYDVSIAAVRMWLDPEAYRRKLADQRAKRAARGLKGRLSAETIAEIKRRWAAGETRIDIAAALNVGEKSVTKYTKGIPHPRLPKVDPVKAVKMLAAGRTTANIAQHFGACERSVRKAIAKLSTRGEWPMAGSVNKEETE